MPSAHLHRPQTRIQEEEELKKNHVLLIALLVLALVLVPFVAACGGEEETTTTAAVTETTVVAAYDINEIVAGIQADTSIVVPDKYKDGVVKVGCDAPYPPWEMFVGETDQFTGFDYDLAQALGAKLGVKFEFVKTIVRQHHRRYPSGQPGRRHVGHVRQQDPPEDGRLRRLRPGRDRHAGAEGQS